MHRIISTGGAVWASTEATESSSSDQRSSVYAQIMTETVGGLSNLSLLQMETAALRAGGQPRPHPVYPPAPHHRAASKALSVSAARSPTTSLPAECRDRRQSVVGRDEARACPSAKAAQGGDFTRRRVEPVGEPRG